MREVLPKGVPKKATHWIVCFELYDQPTALRERVSYHVNESDCVVENFHCRHFVQMTLDCRKYTKSDINTVTGVGRLLFLVLKVCHQHKQTDGK